MYELKKELEDFKVNELLDQTIQSKQETSILLYKLKKTNYTTERAVWQLTKSLNIQRKNIGYAGAKDKQAITTQYITIERANKDKIDGLELKDIELTFIGYAKQKLSLGNLQGNEFEILVRTKKEIETEKPTDFIVPNYFDEQRFSSKNVEVGVAILKNDFKTAVNLLLETDKDHKEELENYLESHINDYVGALKRLPQKTLLFFVHSVQSKLFNEELATLQTKQGDCKEVSYSQGKFVFRKELQTEQNIEELPLIGWDSKPTTALEDLGIMPRQFLIRSMPDLSLEETQRKAYSQVQNCKIEKHDEGYKVRFRLQKGSYATIVIRQLFE